MSSYFFLFFNSSKGRIADAYKYITIVAAMFGEIVQFNMIGISRNIFVKC